jgi:uncharacterized protein (TIGR03086 family)
MSFPALTSALELLRDAATGIPADRLDDPTPCEAWTVSQVLLHAAGDQHAWASFVGTGTLPAYDPFSPPHRLDRGVDVVVTDAIEAAAAAWAEVDPSADSVPTPLPPMSQMTPELAAAACALDAAVHAWDVAVALGRPSPLTADLAERLMPAARATAEPLRGFAYGPAVPAQPGDDAAAALLRYLGRDPRRTV